jgi:hypothetical protein
MQTMYTILRISHHLQTWVTLETLKLCQKIRVAEISFSQKEYALIFFFNSISGGGVQLGLLGTSATNWPIAPAPGDYEDGEFGGMMIGRGSRSTRREPVPVPLCPPQIPHDLTGCEPGPPRWEASD